MALFFVDLSPVTDPQLATGHHRIGAQVPAREQRSAVRRRSSTDNLHDRIMLLLLDNFEQVLPGAEAVAARPPNRSPSLGPRHQPRPARPLRRTGVPDLPHKAPGPRRQSRRPPAKRGREAVRERELCSGRSDVLPHGGNGTRCRDLRRLDGLPRRLSPRPRGFGCYPWAALEQLESRLPMPGRWPAGMRPERRRAPQGHHCLELLTSWKRSVDVLTFFRSLLRLRWRMGRWKRAEKSLILERKLGDAVRTVGDSPRAQPGQRYPTIRRGEAACWKPSESSGRNDWRRAGRPEKSRQLQRRSGSSSWQKRPRGTVTGPGPGARWLDLLRLEHDNPSGGPGLGDRRGPERDRRSAGSALWRFWYARGHMDEGTSGWLERLPSGLPSNQERSKPLARAQSALGGIAYWQGDFGTALERVSGGVGDPPAAWRSVGNGAGASRSGDRQSRNGRSKVGPVAYRRKPDDCARARRTG